MSSVGLRSAADAQATAGGGRPIVIGSDGGPPPPEPSAAPDGEVRRLIASRRRQRRFDVALRVTAPVVVAVLAGIGWQWWANRAHSLMMAPSTKVMKAFSQLLHDGSAWSAAYESAKPLVLGYVISVVAGVVIGFAMAEAKRLERVVDVYVALIMVTPMAAIIPLLMMATGLTLTTRVIVVIVFSFPFVVVNVRAGVRDVDPSLTEMARCFDANRVQVWRRVLAPGAAPGIAVAMRLGLAHAITGTIVVELLLTPVGIGGRILDDRASFHAADMYATIIFITLLSLALLSAVATIERLQTRWRR